MSDDPAGNSVLVFERERDGSLSFEGANGIALTRLGDYTIML